MGAWPCGGGGVKALTLRQPWASLVAARRWVQTRAAWTRHCEECPHCDEEGGAGDACLDGAELAGAWCEAMDAALMQALGGEGSA